jgi:hypothetical protein
MISTPKLHKGIPKPILISHLVFSGLDRWHRIAVEVLIEHGECIVYDTTVKDAHPLSR